MPMLPCDNCHRVPEKMMHCDCHMWVCSDCFEASHRWHRAPPRVKPMRPVRNNTGLHGVTLNNWRWLQEKAMTADRSVGEYINQMIDHWRQRDLGQLSPASTHAAKLTGKEK